jgi:hypothetical protein
MAQPSPRQIRSSSDNDFFDLLLESRPDSIGLLPVHATALNNHGDAPESQRLPCCPVTPAAPSRFEQTPVV